MSSDNDGSETTVEDAKQVIADPDSTEEAIKEAQQIVDKSDQTEEQKAEAEKSEAADKERKDKAYNDQLNNEIAKVAKGEKELSDVPEWLRDDAEKRIKSLSPEPKKTDEDKIVERVKVEGQLERDLELLSDEEGKEYQEAYDDFLEHGYTNKEARSKAKKMFGVLSKAEKERKENLDAMRSVPTGGSFDPSRTSKTREVEKEHDDSQPEYIKALGKKT